ncbi:MAG: M48 family metallopeptidase [Nitrospira sp.]|nr:M48 family metallopeptidase [Nitrospira sp.]
MTWPYGSIRQTQGAYKGEPVRLEYGAEPAQVLVLSDSAFLNALHDAAPGHTRHLHNPLHRGVRVRLTYLAAVAVIVIGGVLYLWGIPGLASVIAPRVPVAWETRLGETVIEHLAPLSARCMDPARTETLDTIVAALMSQAQSPYAMRVVVVRESKINALALPGGFIVVFSGLLERTDTPGQFAGVLAHELQHILKRHTTRAIIEQASTSLLLAVIGGDFSGAMTYGLEGARTLGRLQYSRQFEEEADAEGLRMLQAAGLDPHDMIAFYQTMKEKASDPPGIWAYFSTHPSTEDRIKKLTSLIPASPNGPATFLPEVDWMHTRSICGEPSGVSVGKDH